MPIVESAGTNSAFGHGDWSPSADQAKHGVIWAAVEGRNAGRYPTVRDAQSGIGFGNDGRKKITYREFKDDKGKTHDISKEGTLLREMICDIEDIQEKDHYEAQLSTNQVKDFLESEDLKARERGSEMAFSTKAGSMDIDDL